MQTDPRKHIQDYAKGKYPETLPLPPETVGDAVDHLIRGMTIKDKATVANMDSDELLGLHVGLGTYIRIAFELWHGNDALVESCRSISDDIEDADDASAAIIGALHRELFSSHRLRVVS